MRFFPILLILLSAFTLSAQTSLTDRYIQSYSHIAVQEMHRTGIPASVTLAQGLLESNWGRSTLAVKSNNHFGIKCSAEWSGKSHYRFDDEYNHLGKKKKSCFRVYEDAEASFIDHSEFLKDPKKIKRYGFLFRYDTDDYISWAHGLRKAGYATDPKYANKLITIIEKYGLQQYDSPVIDEIVSVPQAQEKVKVEQSSKKEEYRIHYINSCKVVIAAGGEDLKQIASVIGVSSRKLLKYNEQIQKRSDVLPVGEKIYLEAKKSFFLGNIKIHEVVHGQDLAGISNQYGIDMDYLKDINEFGYESRLQTGDTVKLKRYGYKKKSKKSTRNRAFKEALVENTRYIFEDALRPLKN